MSSPLSTAVCPGCRQPLPANLAAGPPQLTCYQCGAVFANPLVNTADPHGTYRQQLGRSPVSTYLFGPQLNAYQGHADPLAHADRERQYRFWLLAFVAILVASAVVPFLFGTLRMGLFMGLCAAVYCLLFSGMWGLAYGIGIMIYGGALFEKPWFMNSKRAREKRAIWGDVKTRNIYMVFGQVIMAITGVIAGGNALLSSVLLLIGQMNSTPARGGGAGKTVATSSQLTPAASPAMNLGRLKAAEEYVLFERRELEGVAADVRAASKDYSQLEADIAKSPHQLSKRKQLDESGRSLEQYFIKYNDATKSWRKRVAELRVVVTETGLSSDVLTRNQNLPPELTLLNPVTSSSAGRFPVQEVQSAELQLEDALTRLAQLQTRRRYSRSELRVGSIGRLDQHRIRLQEIEQEFGYHSPLLDRLPSRDEIAQIEQRADAADTPERSLAARDRRTEPPRDTPAIPPPPGAPSRATTAASPGGSPSFHWLEHFDETRQVLRGSVTLRGFGPQREMLLVGKADGAFVEFDTPSFLRYTLNARVTRQAGKGPLHLVLPIFERSAVLVVDGADFRTGLEAIDGVALGAPNNKTAFSQGEHLRLDKPVFLRCEVDGPSLVVSIGENEIYRWRGNPNTLSIPENYQVANPKRFHVGCQDASFRIELPVVTVSPR